MSKLSAVEECAVEISKWCKILEVEFEDPAAIAREAIAEPRLIYRSVKYIGLYTV